MWTCRRTRAVVHHYGRQDSPEAAHLIQDLRYPASAPYIFRPWIPPFG